MILQAIMEKTENGCIFVLGQFRSYASRGKACLAGGQAEHLGCNLLDSRKLGASASQQDASTEFFRGKKLAQFLAYDLEQFDHPDVNDVGNRLAGNRTGSNRLVPDDPYLLPLVARIRSRLPVI